MKFRATLELNGKTATGFQVPAEVVAALGQGKRPPVRVTINGHTYRNTVAVMGGVFMLGVSAEHRAAAGVQAGDELEVDFRIECWLTPQQYTLTVATQNADGTSHDWLDDAISFEVVDARSAAGVANLRAEVAWRVSP